MSTLHVGDDQRKEAQEKLNGIIKQMVAVRDAICFFPLHSCFFFSLTPHSTFPSNAQLNVQFY